MGRLSWDDWLTSSQYLDNDKWKHKTGTLVTTFHKPTGEVNLYVIFVYVPQIIFNHTQGQASVSINADPVNEKCTGQQSTKEVFCDDIEGYSILIKTVDWHQQEVTTNWHPCHNLPQSCRGSKYICLICIYPTESFLSHPRKTIGINEH